MRTYPETPTHPERICWGCDRLCSASDLTCGNGSERTQHPSELFGQDWRRWFAGQGSAPSLEPESHG
jgi:hypothetical protein